MLAIQHSPSAESRKTAYPSTSYETRQGRVTYYKKAYKIYVNLK